MAVYAPTVSTGTGSPRKVASLVSANAAGADSDPALSSLTVDGSRYAVVGIPPLAGRDGEVPYLGRDGAPKDGYSPETILRGDVYVCESPDDETKSLAENVTMKEVFTSWIKGGHRQVGSATKWYGYDADYDRDVDDKWTLQAWLDRNRDRGTQPQQLRQLGDGAPGSGWDWLDDQSRAMLGFPLWFYNSSTSSVIQPSNTQDTSYYVSPYEMRSYDITVRCKGYSGDDDVVALIAAMNERTVDGRTVPVYLAASRTPNNQNTNGSMPLGHFCLAANTVTPGLCADGQHLWAIFEPELSARYLHSASALQYRFAQAADGNPAVPPPRRPGGGSWDRLDSYYGAPRPTRELWRALSGIQFERDLSSQLYKISSVEGDGSQWSQWKASSTDRIDPGCLSSPENWWWMDQSQYSRYAACFKNAGWGMSGGNRVYMRVRRQGDKIQAWTTRFTQAAPEHGGGGDSDGLAECPSDWDAAVRAGDAFTLSVDLASDAVVNQISLSSCFSAQARPLGGRMGFVTFSQSGATWDILDMKIPKIIVRTWSNEVIEYDPLDDESKVLDAAPAEFCGKGRLCRNPATGKTFFVGDQGFLKIVDPAAGESEEWTFTVENGASTGEIKKRVVVLEG